MRLLSPLTWALALFCLPVFAEPIESLITASDLLKVNQLSEPALSPDGKLVAYTVRSFETKPTGEIIERSRVWIASIDGSSPTHLLVPDREGVDTSAASPAWHPSGDRIAFIRFEKNAASANNITPASALNANTRRARVWAAPVSPNPASTSTTVASPASEPRALTPPLANVSNARWSPDGNRLLFTASVTFAEARAAAEKSGTPLPVWANEIASRPPLVLPTPTPTSTPTPSPTATPTPSPTPTATPTPTTTPTPSPVIGPDGKPVAKPAVKTAAKPVIKAAPKTAPTPTPTPAIEPSSDGILNARRAWLAANEKAPRAFVTRDINAIDADDVLLTNTTAASAIAAAPTFTHLFVVDRANPTPLDLTPGFVSYDNAIWLSDNKTIVASGSANSSAPTATVLNNGLTPSAVRAIFLLNADTKEIAPLLKSTEFSLDQPAISPDGKLIAVTAQPAQNADALAYGQSRIAVIGLADGKLKTLTDKLDRSVRDPRWSTDGKTIFFLADTAGGRFLHKVAVTGGNSDRIGSPDTFVSGFSVSAKDIAQIVSRAGNPGELYRIRPNGRESRILTAQNGDWVRDKKLTSPDRRKIKAADGTEIEFWVAKPPYIEGGFQYPLLVMIDDGLAEMSGAGDPQNWFTTQFFAARGYGVIFVNPRGSSGYGNKFQRPIPPSAKDATSAPTDPLATPVADVLTVVNAVAKEDWADSDRLIIAGEGYGALIAARILAEDTAKQFKTAALVGAFNEQLDAKTIRVPVLIQNDHKLFGALKSLDRHADYVVYPQSRDTPSPDTVYTAAQRIDRLVRFDEFFQRTVDTPAKPIPLPTITPTPTPTSTVNAGSPATPAPTPTPTPTPTPAPTPAPNMMMMGG